MLAYRIALTLLAPGLVLWAFWRWIRGRDDGDGLRGRLGVPREDAPPRGPGLWVHAASNGELASAEPVLRALLAAAPELHLRITCNSRTGRDLARGWGLDRATADIAPFDWRWTARRALRRHDLRALIVLEAEVWPNRLMAFQQAGRPVFVLGARLSRKTARGWRRFMAVARAVLASVTWLVPQDLASRRRFQRLGLPADRLGPVTDLKALYSPLADTQTDAAIAAAFQRDKTWLAASTHPGEDDTILQAHLIAKRVWPDVQLIIAPRHPQRAAEIVALARHHGLGVRQRSRGEAPAPDAVYLADTMGEMPLLYAAASICFVAGSLVDRGGHTPYEPAAHGCALLHGPYLRNFRDIYRRLDIGGGALQVSDAETLAEALTELSDPARRDALQTNAAGVIGRSKACDEIVSALLARVPL